MIFQRKALAYWSQLVANRHLENPQNLTIRTILISGIWYTLHPKIKQSI